MARIRSIKPEFAKSESIAALPRDVRLHFALLWTYADDDGRGLDNPRLIKAELWPLDDDVTAAVVDGWQSVLADNGRIVRYEVDGRKFFEVVNFGEHQHPQKKGESKYPPPSDGTARVPVPDDYATPTGALSPVVVVGVVDVVGVVEGEGASAVAVADDPVTPTASFDSFWQAYPRKVGKPKALTAFSKATRRAEACAIVAGALRYRDDPNRSDEFTAHPSTWLNRDGWDDPPLPAKTNGKVSNVDQSLANIARALL